VPGVEARVLDEDGQPVEPGQRGRLAMAGPWPAMGRTIWADPERYEDEYFARWGPQTFDAADAARRDADGYLWLLGRADETLNVAGHRLGAAEIEAALVDHDDVLEAAVVGQDHDVKGEVPIAFAVPRDGGPSREALAEHVAETVGPVARPAEVRLASDLPRTRSGKILRRSLEAIVHGEEPGRPPTIANPSTLKALAAELAAAPG
jgi:acetyl-CoA synthetase